MPAKFVVKKGVTGKFRFSLLSANGLVIASSQTYESKASCMAGLRAVQKNAAGAAIDDQTAAAKAAVAAKPAARKTVAKKTVAKKTVARKPVAKKPVAKKQVAKRPAAKKPAARKR